MPTQHPACTKNCVENCATIALLPAGVVAAGNQKTFTVLERAE
jgi:hypothetical protein